MMLLFNAIFAFLVVTNGNSLSQEVEKNAAGWDVILKGRVAYPQEGQITIREIKDYGANMEKGDTIRLKSDQTFTKKIHLVEPGYYMVDFYGKQSVTVILDKSNVELNVDGNNQQGAVEIKGSPDHDLIKKVEEIISTANMGSLREEYIKALSDKDEEKIKALQKKAMNIMSIQKEKLIPFLEQQPVSLALFSLLRNPDIVNEKQHYELLSSFNEKIKKEWPNSRYTKELSERLNKINKISVGKMAPEIELPNPEGKIIKLSSFRGKYVLIDFWAKWCAPCRQENPVVVKAYNRFKNKGFEVLSVSLDKNKEEWVQAIKEDGLNWTNVSDLKYFNSKAAQDYNINAIPFSILVDKTGKIIAQDLRGDKLEKKLEEVIK